MAASPGPFTLGTKNACTSSTRDAFTVSCQCHARLSVSNSAILERKGIRRLRCPKNLLFRVPEFGSRPIGRPVPRFRDVCKRDMLATGLSVKNWELLTEDRSEWKITCSQALKAGEIKPKAGAEAKWGKTKADAKTTTSTSAASGFMCELWLHLLSHIRLANHQKKMPTNALDISPTDAYLPTAYSEYFRARWLPLFAFLPLIFRMEPCGTD